MHSFSFRSLQSDMKLTHGRGSKDHLMTFCEFDFNIGILFHERFEKASSGNPS